jgi:hypothetical protein
MVGTNSFSMSLQLVQCISVMIACDLQPPRDEAQPLLHLADELHLDIVTMSRAL